MEYNTSIGQIFKMCLNSVCSYVKQNVLHVFFFMLVTESKNDRNGINIIQSIKKKSRHNQSTGVLGLKVILC